MEFNQFGMGPGGNPYGSPAPAPRRRHVPNWIAFGLGIAYVLVYLVVNVADLVIGATVLPALLLLLLLPLVIVAVGIVSSLLWPDVVTCVLASVCAALTLILGGVVTVSAWLCTLVAVAMAVFAMYRPQKHASQQYISGDIFQSGNGGTDGLGF